MEREFENWIFEMPDYESDKYKEFRTEMLGYDDELTEEDIREMYESEVMINSIP